MTQGRLTTHVLDTATGTPASNLEIELYRLHDNERSLLKSVCTNQDGRTDSPMLAGGDFTTGTYELVFHAGAYLTQNGLSATEPLFLDVIPIRFGIADVNQHFHVPLLLSPYGYSTYRGS